MKTLIELYDERPIENVLATEVFRPERTVFLCPDEIAQSKKKKDDLRKYFQHRGVDSELIFMASSLYSAEKISRQIRSITEKYPDCVVDITGGTDQALFACGQSCSELGLPAFTYSRKKNSFYGIYNRPLDSPIECTIIHTVEDCFAMAGGALRTGRVDNEILAGYMDDFDPFFRLYLRRKADWLKMINYMQRASQTEFGEEIPLEVLAPLDLKNDRGKRMDVPEAILYDLESIGFLKDVSISRSGVHFVFRDLQIRNWLRDIGSVLELYTYKACIDAGCFNDVRSSAVVDWEGDHQRDGVTNEIDVMAMKGILPVFISCKTSNIETEALNELAILRDRFGGKGAKAVIVTTQHCRSITRHRASELDIEVLDIDDLQDGKVVEHIQRLVK